MRANESWEQGWGLCKGLTPEPRLCVALGQSPHLSVLQKWEGMPPSSIGSGMSPDLESAGGAEGALLHGFALNLAVALGFTLLARPQFPCLEWVSCSKAERKRHAQTFL